MSRSPSAWIPQRRVPPSVRGGGAVLHLNSYIGLSGDVASFLSPRTGESAAWSAGIVFVIPGSPHTFSVQVAYGST